MCGEVNDVAIGRKGFALLFRRFFSDVNVRLWVRRLDLLRLQLGKLQVFLGIAEIRIAERQHLLSPGFSLLFNELEQTGAGKIVDRVFLYEIMPVRTNQSMKRQIVKHIMRDDDQLLTCDVREQRLNEMLVEQS